jgi:hypothetical protein
MPTVLVPLDETAFAESILPAENSQEVMEDQ